MLTNIRIVKLWGINSFDIPISDNKLIIVAENGEGKTVILRIIFYFLSKQWDRISEFDFESISATISSKEYIIKKSELVQNISSKQIKVLSQKYPIYSDFINSGLKLLFKENSISDLQNSVKISKFAYEHSISESVLENIIQDIIHLRFKQFDFEYEIPLIFLPTYRRIEQDFSKIFQELKYKKDEVEEDFTKIWEVISPERWEKNNNALELVEFGLKDIEFKLNKAIKNNKTEHVKAFINKCNSFFVNKRLILEQSKVKIKLHSTQKIFELTKLDIFSSGEKQIISLFFYLLLNNQEYFIVYDEPELSISINWQEKLLDELSEISLGYVVATHSHSIVTENQETYLLSIDDIKK